MPSWVVPVCCIVYCAICFAHFMSQSPMDGVTTCVARAMLWTVSLVIAIIYEFMNIVSSIFYNE